MIRPICFLLVLIALPRIACAQSFEKLKAIFASEYTVFAPPNYVYDYRAYFKNIATGEGVLRQEAFFRKWDSVMQKAVIEKLSKEQRICRATIKYEIRQNLERIKLEKEWINDGRNTPVNGLYTLRNHKEWYQHFVRKYTSTNITPEEVFGMGKAEVARVQKEIARIRIELGYNDEAAFYKHLSDDVFFITDKGKVVAGFDRIDSIVRAHLRVFVQVKNVPPVFSMEWPDANAQTPPGMYDNHENNAYGRDVFQFNFYGQRYNSRVMDWLYMHEAIPGHHLQASLRLHDSLLDMFTYPGNFEGWACYVEYYGKDLGLYADAYSELGKWEWDLVRSVRLVLDAGIHYYGWSREEALKYWRENIKGQDDIAEREVTRVTNWTAQALSYKIGAAYIFKLQEQWLKKHPTEDVRVFRKEFLSNGMVPLAAFEEGL